MKHVTLLLGLGLSGCAMAPGSFHGAAIPAPHESGRLVVDLVDGTSLAEAQTATGLDLQWVAPETEDEALAFVMVADLAATQDRIDDLALVEVAEPSVEVQAFGYPNDPMASAQWNFEMVGAEAGWRAGGGEGIIVAVIDTGVTQVADLEGTEILKGKSFVVGNKSPEDDNGHGTHVAGTIAQTTNNGLGVTGIAPNASILPIKVLSGSGMGRSEWIAAGIDEAVDRGADVINLSLGGPNSGVMRLATQKAIDAGVVVVAAAGNTGRQGVSSPANTPGAIAVSAVGPDDALAFYSTWGKEISISAPGGDKRKVGGGVLQDTIDGKGHAFKEFQGTSMATPHVAGAAAVLLGAGAGNADDVKELLFGSASDMGSPGRDHKYGYGRLDVAQALHQLTWQHRAPLFGFGVLAALGLSILSGSRIRPLTLGFAGLSAGGAFFLMALPLPPNPATTMLALPLLEWPQLMGTFWGGFPLWLSALWPVVLTFVLGPTRTFGPIVAGINIGVGVHLLHGAFTQSLHPWLMNDSLAFGWLALNGLFCLAAAFAGLGVTKLRERETA